MEIPKECPFPTIVENALKRMSEQPENLFVSKMLDEKIGSMPKRKVSRLEIVNSALREEIDRLNSVNATLSDRIRDKNLEIERLRDDNVVLRSVVRRLRKKMQENDLD